MNDRPHIEHQLHDYLDGTLPPEAAPEVEAHLAVCETCQAVYDDLRTMKVQVAALPRSIEPPEDLWPDIEARLAAPPVEALAQRRNGRVDRPSARPHARRRRTQAWGVALALVVLVGVGLYGFGSRLMGPTWEVARLEGTPRVGTDALTDKGTLRTGEWLETDAASRAKLDVGAIGNVEVDPNTRLRLLAAEPTDHRLSLAEGKIHARIWAPPRLFFVETPSALAVDLGCAYTLEVDSTGGAWLHVTSGYVALEHPERDAVVPAGSMALTRPGQGPGTPFADDATDAFRDALARLDFEDGGEEALAILLAEARPEDAATLWQLRPYLDPAFRARLYDRLVALVPPPEGVTREGVLREDPSMIAAWQHHLALEANDWWKFWEKDLIITP